MKIYFTENLVKHETGKARLIKLPGSSKAFWLPESLIYPTRGKYWVGYIPDGFVVTSAKSHLAIDEAELEAAFESTNHSLTGVEEIEHHKPEHEEPIEPTIDDSLKR